MPSVCLLAVYQGLLSRLGMGITIFHSYGGRVFSCVPLVVGGDQVIQCQDQDDQQGQD